MRANSCRFCQNELEHVFADLGMSPLANSYLKPEELGQMEPFFPLRALVCARCLLVQLEDYESPETIFSEYAYFSSYSTTWLEHSKRYCDLVVERFGLNATSHVVEVASNDGYLLQYFQERQIQVLGIEPAANVAKVALQKGIPTIVEFFGRDTAGELVDDWHADLLIGNNVLAHVPDLNDFVGGLTVLLRPRGVITMEFPHLLHLMEDKQFDTIYHEHFSYFSLLTVERVFAEHGLEIFDVDELPTHGGSLRIYAHHAEDETHALTDSVAELRQTEERAGLGALDGYVQFGQSVQEAKRAILEFLIARKSQGATIVGYGAPAKGNTLLNYCGVGTDFLDYTVDLNPHKQGCFLPGTHIPIRHPDAIRETRPDLILILPWNLRDEIMQQLSFVREWGGQFAARAPEMTLYK
jgi:SAM-dependent methyltransferase